MTLVDTGEDTMTGGRLKRVRDTSRMKRLLLHLRRRRRRRRHQRPDRVSPSARKHWRPSPRCSRRGRFGALEHRRRPGRAAFSEKPQGDGALDQRRILRALAEGHRLHRRRRTPSGSASRWNGWPRTASCGLPAHGFWQPMDTLRDKMHLEELWQAGKAPWKVWK